MSVPGALVDVPRFLARFALTWIVIRLKSTGMGPTGHCLQPKEGEKGVSFVVSALFLLFLLLFSLAKLHEEGAGGKVEESLLYYSVSSLPREIE